MAQNCFWSSARLDPWTLFLVNLLFITDYFKFASYVDEDTPYVSHKDKEEVTQSLEKASKVLFKWFSDNLMEGNADKCHLLVNTSYEVNIRINNIDIYNRKCEKLLGVKFDYKLTFYDHISKLHKKASRKDHMLARVRLYIKKMYSYDGFFHIAI